MAASRKLVLAEMIAASVVSSTGLYLMSLRVIAVFWLLFSSERFWSMVRAEVTYAIWIVLFFWIARFPVRVYMQLRQERKAHAQDFEGIRLVVESTPFVVSATAIAIAGLLFMVFSAEWETWSLLLALPLVWIVGLRRLFSLPDPMHPLNRLATEAPEGISPSGSEWLRDGEIEYNRAKEDWENR